MSHKRLTRRTLLFSTLPLFLLGVLTALLQPIPSQPRALSRTGLPLRPPPDPSRKCLHRIVYDTPKHEAPLVKPLDEYISSFNGALRHCEFPNCERELNSICNATDIQDSYYGQLSASVDVIHCVRQMGYYVITSIRHPLERWFEVFGAEQQHHLATYGTPYERSMQDFITTFPDCSLLHYYDARGAHCADDTDVEERILAIVERFDEVVDLSSADGGDGLLAKRLKVDDIRGSTGIIVRSRGFMEMGRLRNEMKLYEALKGKRGVEGRLVC